MRELRETVHELRETNEYVCVLLVAEGDGALCA